MKSKTVIAISLIIAITAPAIGQVFDSEGRRLDSSLQPKIIYQWTDPKTGKAVTSEIPPPTNLNVREIDRRKEGINTVVILEATLKEKDPGPPKGSVAVKYKGSEKKEPQAADAIAACLSAARDRIAYKDADSLRVEGPPIIRYTTATGEVRQSITIMVNAKNSFGAYAGAKPVTCILGADNATVIAVSGG